MKKLFPIFFVLMTTVMLSQTISNGDFENWTSGEPDDWNIIDSGINVTEETTIVHAGNSSASVEVTTGTQKNTDFRQTISVTNGESYDISVWIYHTEGNVKARIVAGSDYGDYSDNSITGQWQEVTWTYTASADENVDFGLRFYDQSGFDGSEIVYVDDYSINGTTPVELTSFTANVAGNSVLLNWKTATETNNYGFEIERKNQNKNVWNKIGFVEGNGTSNSPKEYSFSDVVSTSGKYYYRLKQIDIDGAYKYSNIVEVNIGTPSKFELSQNYPNPFNPETTIKYGIAKNNVNVTLKIYNVLGKEIATLVNEKKDAGNYSVKFDASKLNSGVYFYTISAGNYTATKKMILMK